MKRFIILTIAFLTIFRFANGQVTTAHLDAYLWEYPLQQSLVIEPELMEELVMEMEKIIESGDLFFRPLPNDFADQIWDHYFLYTEPGRILKTIAMAYPYLDTGMQATLRTMVQDLFADPVHRPWSTGPLPLEAGKERKAFAPETLWGQNANFGLYRPTIQNVYNIWLYVYRTGHVEAITPAYYSQILSFYNNKLGSSDRGRLYGSMKAHIGMARLAQIFEDNDRMITARDALESALSFGLDMNDVDTLASRGHSNQYWDGAYRYLYEWSPASPPWPNMRNWDWVNRNYIFHNISPEIGRYLQDYLSEETEARHDYMMNRFPMWWLRESPYFNRWTGDEGIGIPSSSFGTNVPLERWFRNADAETLASYMISSPVGVADSYWIEALVMAIEANATDVFVDVREVPFGVETDPSPIYTNIWTGSLSNDWHNPTNWQDGQVPTATSNVLIPETAINFPTLNETGECLHLMLESSSSGTASIIDNGFLNVHGVVTARRYIESANWNDSQHGWHLISSPVQNQAIEGDWTPAGPGNDYDFYAWSETTISSQWLNQKQSVNEITHFIPGMGYLVAYQAGGVKEFRGELNQGNVQYELSYSEGNSWTGWNLMGNPYQSAINWSLAEKNAFQDDFAYIYSSGREGGPGYIPVGGPGATLSNIPLHQGFFVLANDDQHGQQYSILNELRVHGDEWLKTTNNNPVDFIELQVSHQNFFDYTRIQILENSSFMRDRKDALKLQSFSIHMPNIFSLSVNGFELEINSIPSWDNQTSVLVGFTLPQTGDYKLKLSKTSGTFANKNIIVKDLDTGSLHNLKMDQSISFFATQGQNSPRFSLGVLDATTTNDLQPGETFVWYWQGNLIVDLGTSHKKAADLLLFDLTGRLVFTRKIEKEGSLFIPMKLSPGVYISKLIIDASPRIQKVPVSY